VARLSGRASHEGIHRFTALVAEDNMAVARMLRNTSASLADRGPGTVEYEIPLVLPRKSTATPAAGRCQHRVRVPC
jgi:hypothetical protein